MFTADEPLELERLIADMYNVGCTVSWTKTCIWIGGNTYPIRQSLKNAGWRWSAKKKQWWMSADKWFRKPEETGVIKEVDSNGDYKLTGRTNNGQRVVIAECHTEDISKYNPWNDLDYALGY